MDNEIVTQEETAVIPMTANSNSLEEMERSMEQTDRLIAVMDSIRKKCVRLTNKNDWINQAGVPYLEASGCDKIAKCFGVQISEISCERESYTDEHGEFYQFTTSGTGKWLNNISHEIGVTNTRDKFFARKKIDGESTLLPLSEIDLPSVKKKSHTNFMNRMIKKLLGLSYTWEEIEEMSAGKVTEQLCSKFSYDKGKKGGKTTPPADTKKVSLCRKMMLELCGGDSGAAKKMLMSMTEFTAPDGKEVKGKSRVEDVTPKQFNSFVYPKIKTQYDAFMKQNEVPNE